MSGHVYPPILDGHNDTLLRLHLIRGKEGSRFEERSKVGHVDLPRMEAGGMAGGFFAMYAPSPGRRVLPNTVNEGMGDQIDQAYGLDYILHEFTLLRGLDRRLHDRFRIVRDVEELKEALQEERSFAIAHIEDAAPIDEDLDLLPLLYDLGLRSVGLVWSRPNVFGCGVPFTFPGDPDAGPGLTDSGRALVRACNEMGILVDMSHLNEKGFWDVAQVSDAPLVATHSCVHALSPATRNLKDSQLDAIRDSKGIVGINFHVGFLRKDGRSNSPTSCSEIVRHARYMTDRMGIDHVALGSDFDGAVMPTDLAGADQLPNLMGEFVKAGFSSDELAKIAHGNWVRVLEATWR